MNAEPVHQYVFRTETSIDPQGRKLRIIWRRKLLSQTAEACHLGGVERAVCLEGQAVTDWEPAIGLLASSAVVPLDRMQAAGYSEKAPREVQQ